MGYRADFYIPTPHLKAATDELDGVEHRPSREEILPPTDGELAQSRATVERWKAEACPLHYPVPSEACPACGARS